MMTPERWQQIDDLLQEALELPIGQRTAFLDKACAGDTALRDEVLSLLRYHEQAEAFIETPPSEVATLLLEEKQLEPTAGSLIGHYKVIRQIGRGGMGEVYLAKDKKLGRQVALKILPKVYTSDKSRLLRFQQEARAASALNHPNIITIFEVGQVEETFFMATEFIDGSTLHEVIGKDGMELIEALEAAIQVAGALATAHQAGIAHRDIKPDNIMVRQDGYVKVLDFGLAKLTEPEECNGDSSYDFSGVQTSPGIVLGTLDYMSPEQLSGVAVDARTDIFSFGVMLYEMVTGHLPFEGKNRTELIISIVEREAPPINQYLPEAPPKLQEILSKALTKDKEKRYQSIKDLMSDLKSLKQELELVARLKRSDPEELRAYQSTLEIGRKTVEGGAGRSTKPIATQLVELIREHKKQIGPVLLSLILLMAGVGIGINFFTAQGKKIDSMAVLPFVNSIGDPELDYLSDGITESIINSLSQLPKLKVMARTTVFRYKGQQADPEKVGRDLKVDAVLTGRVIQQGDTFVIQTELVNTADGRQLWGEKYNRKLLDIIAVQEDIAKQISEKLRNRLTGEEKEQLTRRYTEKADAYQAYLKGRYFWSKRSWDGFNKAVENFKLAIKLDPNYALAYTGLADCYVLFPNYEILPPKEALPKAREAVMKALELDDRLAEAHASLGQIKRFEWDYAGAEAEFKRSIELNPNYATTHHWYAGYLTGMGRFDEAFEEMGRALELDPFSLAMNRDLGDMLYTARLFDQAIKQYQKTLDMDPNFSVHHLIGVVYQQKGMLKEAMEEYFNEPGDPKEIAVLKEIYNTKGWNAYQEKCIEYILASEKAKESYISPYFLAMSYADLGRKEEALEWLEKSYEDGSIGLRWVKFEPRFDPIRSDPRFADLLRRIGL